MRQDTREGKQGGHIPRIRFFLALLTGLMAMHCVSSGAPDTGIKKVPLVDIKEAELQEDTFPEGLDTFLYSSLVSRLFRDQSTALWPIRTVYPKEGAILPFFRVVAFYGNLFSKHMGILGALPPDKMLDSLRQEVRRWESADSITPVKPALHYIAVTAQLAPGRDEKYRLRMPDVEIRKVLDLADRIGALVFLDIQVGHSSLEEEIPHLREYLLLPNVHLGIDPEYDMKDKSVPGDKVGIMDAAEINYATTYLSALVTENNLPPKILVVHRFKTSMVTNAKEISLSPEVQIVMNMDGFGSRARKKSTYAKTIAAEPVQFAGFKLFYINDPADAGGQQIMQPAEILGLNPVPIYIQYQ